MPITEADYRGFLDRLGNNRAHFTWGEGEHATQQAPKESDPHRMLMSELALQREILVGKSNVDALVEKYTEGVQLDSLKTEIGSFMNRRKTIPVSMIRGVMMNRGATMTQIMQGTVDPAVEQNAVAEFREACTDEKKAAKYLAEAVKGIAKFDINREINAALGDPKNPMRPEEVRQVMGTEEGRLLSGLYMVGFKNCGQELKQFADFMMENSKIGPSYRKEPGNISRGVMGDTFLGELSDQNLSDYWHIVRMADAMGGSADMMFGYYSSVFYNPALPKPSTIRQFNETTMSAEDKSYGALFGSLVVQEVAAEVSQKGRGGLAGAPARNYLDERFQEVRAEQAILDRKDTDDILRDPAVSAHALDYVLHPANRMDRELHYAHKMIDTDIKSRVHSGQESIRDVFRLFVPGIDEDRLTKEMEASVPILMHPYSMGSLPVEKRMEYVDQTRRLADSLTDSYTRYLNERKRLEEKVFAAEQAAGDVLPDTPEYKADRERLQQLRAIIDPRKQMAENLRGMAKLAEDVDRPREVLAYDPDKLQDNPVLRPELIDRLRSIGQKEDIVLNVILKAVAEENAVLRAEGKPELSENEFCQTDHRDFSKMCVIPDEILSKRDQEQYVRDWITTWRSGEAGKTRLLNEYFDRMDALTAREGDLSCLTGEDNTPVLSDGLTQSEHDFLDMLCLERNIQTRNLQGYQTNPAFFRTRYDTPKARDMYYREVDKDLCGYGRYFIQVCTVNGLQINTLLDNTWGSSLSTASARAVGKEIRSFNRDRAATLGVERPEDITEKLVYPSESVDHIYDPRNPFVSPDQIRSDQEQLLNAVQQFEKGAPIKKEDAAAIGMFFNENVAVRVGFNTVSAAKLRQDYELDELDQLFVDGKPLKEFGAAVYGDYDTASGPDKRTIRQQLLASYIAAAVSGRHRTEAVSLVSGEGGAPEPVAFSIRLDAHSMDDIEKRNEHSGLRRAFDFGRTRIETRATKQDQLWQKDPEKDARRSAIEKGMKDRLDQIAAIRSVQAAQPAAGKPKNADEVKMPELPTLDVPELKVPDAVTEPEQAKPETAEEKPAEKTEAPEQAKPEAAEEKHAEKTEAPEQAKPETAEEKPAERSEESEPVAAEEKAEERSENGKWFAKMGQMEKEPRIADRLNFMRTQEYAGTNIALENGNEERKNQKIDPENDLSAIREMVNMRITRERDRQDTHEYRHMSEMETAGLGTVMEKGLIDVRNGMRQHRALIAGQKEGSASRVYLDLLQDMQQMMMKDVTETLRQDAALRARGYAGLIDVKDSDPKEISDFDRDYSHYATARNTILTDGISDLDMAIESLVTGAGTKLHVRDDLRAALAECEDANSFNNTYYDKRGEMLEEMESAMQQKGGQPDVTVMVSPAMEEYLHRAVAADPQKYAAFANKNFSDVLSQESISANLGNVAAERKAPDSIDFVITDRQSVTQDDFSAFMQEDMRLRAGEYRQVFDAIGGQEEKVGTDIASGWSKKTEQGLDEAFAGIGTAREVIETAGKMHRAAEFGSRLYRENILTQFNGKEQKDMADAGLDPMDAVMIGDRSLKAYVGDKYNALPAPLREDMFKAELVNVVMNTDLPVSVVHFEMQDTGRGLKVPKVSEITAFTRNVQQAFHTPEANQALSDRQQQANTPERLEAARNAARDAFAHPRTARIRKELEEVKTPEDLRRIIEGCRAGEPEIFSDYPMEDLFSGTKTAVRNGRHRQVYDTADASCNLEENRDRLLQFCDEIDAMPEEFHTVKGFAQRYEKARQRAASHALAVDPVQISDLGKVLDKLDSKDAASPWYHKDSDAYQAMHDTLKTFREKTAGLDPLDPAQNVRISVMMEDVYRAAEKYAGTLSERDRKSTSGAIRKEAAQSILDIVTKDVEKDLQKDMWVPDTTLSGTALLASVAGREVSDLKSPEDLYHVMDTIFINGISATAYFKAVAPDLHIDEAGVPLSPNAAGEVGDRLKAIFDSAKTDPNASTFVAVEGDNGLLRSVKIKGTPADASASANAEKYNRLADRMYEDLNVARMEALQSYRRSKTADGAGLTREERRQAAIETAINVSEGSHRKKVGVSGLMKMDENIPKKDYAALRSAQRQASEPTASRDTHIHRP